MFGSKPQRNHPLYLQNKGTLYKYGEWLTLVAVSFNHTCGSDEKLYQFLLLNEIFLKYTFQVLEASHICNLLSLNILRYQNKCYHEGYFESGLFNLAY